MKSNILGEQLTYNGYNGSVNYSDEDDCWYGKILGISDLYMYEADTDLLLFREFKKQVDDYIATKKTLTE